MEIRIQGTNSFTVSKRIEDYILKRVEKLNYFKAHIDEIIFYLTSEKLIYKISATLAIKKSGVHKFEAHADEMYTAIDKVIHKIDVKINREKTKMQKHNNLSHQEIAEFFTHHESNKPEPTRNIQINNKPSTLTDAFLQMNVEGNDFYGFILIESDTKIAPAFLRKLDDDIIYLFKKKDEDVYSEFSIKTSNKSIEEDKKIRDIVLKKMELLDAQKDILDQDYHFNLFIDNNDKINFLFKEGNGKWKLIHN